MNATSHSPHAIVIGASSGIGMEVARILIGKGYTTGVAARRVERLQPLAQLAPERVITAHIDVTSEQAGEDFQRLCDDLGGNIDLLVYAAGIGFQNTNLDQDVELKTVQTNAVGFSRIITHAFNRMAAQGHGHIAAITSIAGTKGLGAAPAYSATKAMQNTYLQALEQLAAMRRLNIRFTDIRPGFVDTALLNDGNSYPLLLKPEKVAEQIVRAIDCKRHIRVIDWKWRLITAAWRKIPRCIWRRLPIKS